MACPVPQVFPIRDANGIAVDFRVEGDFPKFGNDDTRVDTIAQWVVRTFHNKLSRQRTYRGGIPTLSVSTITSNVVYGKKTGTTPDGRRKGVAFASGANAMHGRDVSGGTGILMGKPRNRFCLAAIDVRISPYILILSPCSTVS